MGWEWEDIIDKADREAIWERHLSWDPKDGISQSCRVQNSILGTGISMYKDFEAGRGMVYPRTEKTSTFEFQLWLQQLEKIE